jgi:hypothetical protein
MRGTVPTIQCDAEDGFCGAWDVDHYETGASSVDGVRMTTEQRSPGWVSTKDTDHCPEHATPEETR